MAFYKVLFVVALVCLPLVQSFDLNSNDSHSEFENDNQDHMSRRVDNLQAQIQLQNKTLESQSALIQQILNYSRQSSSIETISNELAVLRTFVQRITDEYQRLSTEVNTTDLALKINSLANSIQILTTSFTSQQHVDVDLMRKLEFLNATVLGLQPSLNRIASIEQYLLFVNHSLRSLGFQNQHKNVTLTKNLQNFQTKHSAIQGTVTNERRASTLRNQYATISTKLNALTQDVGSAKNSVKSLQTVVSQSQRNQKNISNQISTLSSQYSSLSTLLHKTESRVTTLESQHITDIRLTGANHSGEGRVEVKYKGSWGTVCDDSFTDKSANVVCSQLGYSISHATFKSRAAFGQGSGEIVLDDVVCTGDEYSIAVCRHNGFGRDNCGHREDVGVICFGIRLTGGSSSREGRVEVKVGHTWGTVCDDSWDENDARVVCRMLEYSTGSVRAYSRAHFGEGTGPILMDNVHCTGSERSLALCPFRGFGHNDCGHSEDAGVACK